MRHRAERELKMLRPLDSKYKVVAGDSLWMIASREYGEPLVWPAIAKANRLPDPNLILVGMWLKLPPVDDPRHHHKHGKPHKPPNGITQLNSPSPAVRLPVAAPQPPAPAPLPATGARVPQHTGNVITYAPASRAKNGAAKHLAIPVLFPAVKYKLDDLKTISIITPEIDIYLRFIGEVSLQQKGTMAEVELSQRGTLSEKLKVQYDSAFANLVGQAKVGFNSQTRAVQVSFNLAVAAKLDGHVLATNQYEYIPPNRFKYSYRPTPVKGEWQNLVFTGTAGFELEIVVKKPDYPPSVEPVRDPVTVPVPVTRRVPVWAWFAAGGLVVAAGAIIVADVVKDVGTAGLGLAESPLSFAAASALFAEGAAMVH